MSRRWFVSSVGVGAANEARAVRDGRPLLRTSVRATRTLGGASESFPIDGPELALLGPGDVVGFERALVAREEPPPGTTDAAVENLACVELTDASLPWQFSRPAADGRALPWIVLVVLREDEARLTDGSPLPLLTAPAGALPDLADSWAWAHVEARVADSAPGPQADVEADVRGGSRTVIAPCSAPAGWRPTAAGSPASCRRPTPASRPGSTAAATPRARSRRRGDAARAARSSCPSITRGASAPASTAPSRSWRGSSSRSEPPTCRASAAARSTCADRGRTPTCSPARRSGSTVSLQGALRVPGSEVAEERWSDEPSGAPTRERFAAELRRQLDAPARRFATVREQFDRDEAAVAPPLYGFHFAGLHDLSEGGWPSELNLQVRHRVAAALGTRYVQLEQEFLMARAWEQLGQIRAANKLLAVRELSSEAATVAQLKHLAPMAATEVVGLSHTLAAAVPFEGAGTLDGAFARSALPDGAASAAFKRLARPAAPSRAGSPARARRWAARRRASRCSPPASRGASCCRRRPRPSPRSSRRSRRARSAPTPPRSRGRPRSSGCCPASSRCSSRTARRCRRGWRR